MADKAVDILREELKVAGSSLVNKLSIRVKWGQNDLIGLGPLRGFLEKYPDVFAFEGQAVSLAPDQLATSKAPGGAPPGAPTTTKAGGPPPPPVPKKRGHDDAGGKGGDPAGAPTSKAKWAGATAEDFSVDKGKGKKGKGGKDMAEAKAEFTHDAHQNSNFTLSPSERKAALKADTLLSSQAQASIEAFKTNGVEIELTMLCKKLMPGAESRRNAQRCLALVRSAVSSHHSGQDAPSIELSGSYAQGTEVLGSAMDLALRLPASFTVNEKEAYVSELRGLLAQQHMLEVSGTMQNYPHTTSPMAIELKDAQLAAHIVLEDQRVDRPPSLDAVIKQLCDSFEASYELIRLVKVWSGNHNLTFPQDGFMNGAAWTVLVIFFLQKAGLVPPYSIISQGGPVTPATSTLPMSTLLQNFFDFLMQRGSFPLGISLWQGNEFQGPSALFLEDPAHFLETRQQKSLCDNLGEAQWGRIREEAKKAWTRIKVRPGRWFHWAEVFDPTDRKPAKIHGLGEHLTRPLEAEPAHDGKGNGKGMGKDFDGNVPGKGKNAKDADGGKGWAGKDGDSKGKSGKDSYGKDGGYGKDAGKGDGAYGKEASKGGKDDGKGYGKDDGKGYGKDDGKGYGKDAGKGYGKDDGKGYGGKDKGKDFGGKDYGKGKGGYGKPY